MNEVPTEYVQGYAGGLKFFAKKEFFQAIREAMKNKSCVDIIDIDGELGTLNGKWIESVFLSTIESRESFRKFESMRDEEEETKQSWE